MIVMQKINNNVALCKDDNGNELIAIGKGIGFPKCPYELKDLNIIQRTYYGISREYIGLVKEIRKEVFEEVAKIIDYTTSQLDVELNPNLLFTLADHINFAIERSEKNIHTQPPYIGSLTYLYEKEMDIAKQAVVHLNKQLHIHLPKEEAASIAMHIITAEQTSQTEDKRPQEMQMIEQIVSIVEKHFGISLNRETFNYSRFITHLQYLLKSLDRHEEKNGESEHLFETLKEEYPKTYDCVLEIKAYIEQVFQHQLKQEEMLYLMLHVNRLTSRERI